tara:strand:- start:476 stop:1114 length:639 start_codon:yes stop_codon:yes gene_type:complete
MLTPNKQNGYLKNYLIEPKLKQFHLKWNITEKYLTQKRNCLDIGSHIGVYAIEFSKHFETVNSFEPTPKIYNMLESNTKNFDNITTYNVAASNDTRILPLLENPRVTESNIIFTEDTKSLHNRKKRFGIEPILVESKPIDSYNFKDVDFIKIDTERYTMPVLEGIVKTLESNEYPLLQIEIDDRMNDIIEFLKKFGYNKLEERVHKDYWFKK